MIVIKYYTTFLNMTNATYEIATTPFKVGKIVTKDEAKRYITENGLVLASKDENGCIWDTPERAFYNKFQGMAKDIRD
jgi:hypothetical protein